MNAIYKKKEKENKLPEETCIDKAQNFALQAMWNNICLI